MADKTLNTKIQLRHDTAANWTAASSTTLLVGEVGIETDTNKIKIGDGETPWSSLSYAYQSANEVSTAISNAEDNMYTVTASESLTDAQAITTYFTTNNVSYSKGDIVAVKREFGDGQFSYTGYVYNGSDWAAMDGNYNAENVYFADDLTYTAAIGVLTQPSGSAQISATGKNVKQVLSSILAKRENPTITNPSITLTGTQSGSDVEIGTAISASSTLTGTFNAGSYTYGPATGITVETWAGEVKYTAGQTGSIATTSSSSTPYNYSFVMGADNITSVTVQFAETASYTVGAVAKDNLGDLTGTVDGYPEVKIAAGSITKTSSAKYTSYRKMFYGTAEAKETLDSSKIRNLTGVKAATKADNSLAVSVPLNALRVIIAVPNTLKVTSVHDRNGLGAEIFSSFTSTTINVEGANGFTAATYNLYYLDYANANDKANYYDVTIANA